MKISKLMVSVYMLGEKQFNIQDKYCMRFSELYEHGPGHILYHATYVDSVIQILKEDKIRSSNVKSHAYINGKSVVGLSLTRSKWFANNYADAVLVLDGNALRSNFKMIPYVDQQLPNEHDGDNRREAETYIVGEIDNLHRYLLDCYITGSTSVIDQDEKTQFRDACYEYGRRWNKHWYN